MEKIVELSLEQKYEGAKASIAGLFALLGIFAKKIQEGLGSEGLDFIKDTMRNFALEFAKVAKPQIKGEGTKEVGSWFLGFVDTLGIQYDLKEVSDKRVQINFPSCPYNLDNHELCKALMVLDEVLMETLGPGLKFSYPKQVASGDPCCEWILEAK